MSNGTLSDEDICMGLTKKHTKPLQKPSRQMNLGVENENNEESDINNTLNASSSSSVESYDTLGVEETWKGLSNKLDHLKNQKKK